MKYCMRFTAVGLAGAFMFVGSIAACGLLWNSGINAFGQFETRSSLATNPLTYVALATAWAAGLAMMISGRVLEPLQEDGASANQPPETEKAVTPMWGKRTE